MMWGIAFKKRDLVWMMLIETFKSIRNKFKQKSREKEFAKRFERGGVSIVNLSDALKLPREELSSKTTKI